MKPVSVSSFIGVATDAIAAITRVEVKGAVADVVETNGKMKRKELDSYSSSLFLVIARRYYEVIC